MGTQAAPVHISALEQVLLLALELAAVRWRVVFCDLRTGKRRAITLPAWDRSGFVEQLRRAKQQLGLAGQVRVICCQEAGRDGFSVHHFLESLGLESLVIDAASVSVPRHQRRAKTDRLDAEGLMDRLVQYVTGAQQRVWRVVVVPSQEDEERRQLHRAREVLLADRKRIVCRMRSLLALVGVRLSSGKPLREIGALTCWDGSPLPTQLRLRLEDESERLALVQQQLRRLQARREQMVKQDTGMQMQLVRLLMRLQAVGMETAWYLVMECFGYRRFNNRRQVGAYPGLTPTPYDSGQSRREQGIGKAGNHRLRWILVELAWSWLRRQPASALSRWFRERFGGPGKRHRRVGIVALARKLQVALWQYVEHGIVPEGALLKS